MAKTAPKIKQDAFIELYTQVLCCISDTIKAKNWALISVLERIIVLYYNLGLIFVVFSFDHSQVKFAKKKPDNEKLKQNLLET